MNILTKIPISDVHIIFCVSEETALSAIARMREDAHDGIVAVDIETAPEPFWIDRLAALASSSPSPRDD